MFLITCNNCGTEHSFGPGAFLGAKYAQCTCGATLIREEGEMSDPTMRSYVEVSCETCQKLYQEQFSELDSILKSVHSQVFITTCPDCSSEQVIMMNVNPEIFNNQIVELEYPNIGLGDLDELKYHDFILEVKKRVAEYMYMIDEDPFDKIQSVDFSTDENYPQGDVAERARISTLGKLPGSLAVHEFFLRNPALDGKIPWELD